ncbi:uncharacterized protein LOC141602418 [Silene latifolia]|uniref:uncharacterized protein LOC141602418 n=1 Tax=Silene latifolia TaxID=37657 RepID=UPI003D78773F
MALLFTNMALKATMGKVPYKYLCVVDDKGSLEYAADEVIRPGTKFAIENAPGDLFHIRSCSNNKYWVRDAKNLIVAQAVEPVVDQTSPDCTLFSIRMDDINKTATFYHVQSGRVVGLALDVSGIPTNILSIDPTATTQAVSVVDYDALPLLSTAFGKKEIGIPDIVSKSRDINIVTEKDLAGGLNWSSEQDDFLNNNCRWDGTNSPLVENEN